MPELGLGIRIGIEMVSALIVGVGLGLLVDHWLGSAPFGLIVFFFLGVGAGAMNIYRAINGLGLAVGYRPAPRRDGQQEKSGKDSQDRGQDA